MSSQLPLHNQESSQFRSANVTLHYFNITASPTLSVFQDCLCIQHGLLLSSNELILWLFSESLILWGPCRPLLNFRRTPLDTRFSTTQPQNCENLPQQKTLRIPPKTPTPTERINRKITHPRSPRHPPSHLEKQRSGKQSPPRNPAQYPRIRGRAPSPCPSPEVLTVSETQRERQSNLLKFNPLWAHRLYLPPLNPTETKAKKARTQTH